MNKGVLKRILEKVPNTIQNLDCQQIWASYQYTTKFRKILRFNWLKYIL
jgi:hypothetical protein